MRHTPRYLMTDPLEVKRVIRGNAWATFVTNTSKGLVASHYPVILDESREDEIVIVSHFGRPDDEIHELGQHEVLVIIQGPHDYVSSSLYEQDDFVPTWNHVTAHLYGTPEVLSDDENFMMLSKLTDHFEQHFEGGRSLSENEEKARQTAKGTVGLRMVVTRFDARAKLSQNKSEGVKDRIEDHFVGSNPQLAREMKRVRENKPVDKG
jgi:transcriptional regulator